ncbi:hypothetical protein AVEN_24924-1, partial [Araneus ventricosus]
RYKLFFLGGIEHLFRTRRRDGVGEERGFFGADDCFRQGAPVMRSPAIWLPVGSAPFADDSVYLSVRDFETSI